MFEYHIYQYQSLLAMKTLRHYAQRMLLLALLGMMLVQNLAFACPNCKDNFDLNTTNGGIGIAYGYTIYLMILLPVAIIITLVVKVKRRMDANDRTQFYREAGNNAAGV